MSERIDVVLDHAEAQWNGVVSFDGLVLEFFGFAKPEGFRIHVEQIESLELSLEEGRLRKPFLSVRGGRGPLGRMQDMRPDEAEGQRLEGLVEAVRAAASGKGRSI